MRAIATRTDLYTRRRWVASRGRRSSCSAINAGIVAIKWYTMLGHARPPRSSSGSRGRMWLMNTKRTPRSERRRPAQDKFRRSFRCEEQRRPAVLVVAPRRSHDEDREGHVNKLQGNVQEGQRLRLGCRRGTQKSMNVTNPIVVFRKSGGRGRQIAHAHQLDGRPWLMNYGSPQWSFRPAQAASRPAHPAAARTGESAARGAGADHLNLAVRAQAGLGRARLVEVRAGPPAGDRAAPRGPSPKPARRCTSLNARIAWPRPECRRAWYVRPSAAAALVEHLHVR